jgi:hypothetical protein
MTAWAVPIPSTPAEALVWCQVALVWFTANHRGNEEPVGRQALHALDDAKKRAWFSRTLLTSAAAAVVVAALPGLSVSHVRARLALAALSFFLLAVQPWVRIQMGRSDTLSKYFAEWEIFLSLSFLGCVGALTAVAHLTVSEPIVRLPLQTGQLAAVTIALAAVTFMFGGATHIVRGVLDKADALPRLSGPPAGAAPCTAAPTATATSTSTATAATTTPPAPVPILASADADDAPSARADVKPIVAGAIDIPEYNRGRTIGNIERLVMLAVVVLGNYEALGFILAAKGLIRASEFDDRDFAEYFIVGSLSSVAVALLVGVSLRPLILFLWTL